MRKWGHHTLCYLNDFVGVAKTTQEAEAAYAEIISGTAELRLKFSHQKCVPPSTDFSVSTTEMTIKIPQDRLQDVIAEYEVWKTKLLASRRKLQCLIGRIQHVGKCVRPAHSFMARILAALRAEPLRGRHLVPEDLKRDIEWFTTFAGSTNGIVLLLDSDSQHWTI